MNKNLSATQKLNRRFLVSLLVISLIIGLTELWVIAGIELYQQAGKPLNSMEVTAADTLFLTLISAPLLWFIVMRPLVVSITLEQEKVHEQMRQNKELRSALDAHALVSITDIKGRITFANEKFLQISGYSAEELLGQDHRIVNSGYHDKAFFRNLWQTITAGEIWQGIICNRTKHGELYWIDSTIMPLLDELGKPKQYISVRRDITLQKATEFRLKTLKRAVDACSDMILITDAVGGIQYANPALYTFSGWTQETLVGRNVKVFNSRQNNPNILQSLDQALAKGESWFGRILSRRKGIEPIRIAGQALPPDPREFWSETSITPVLNDDGSLFGYVQLFRDISATVQEEIQQQIERDDVAARYEIADTLQRNIPLKERFETTLNILFKLNSVDTQRKGGVFLKSETENVLNLFVLQGTFSEEFIEKEQKVLFGECLCGRAALNNEILISDDCFCDPRHEHTFTGMKAHGHFIVPLAVGDDMLGVMFLYTDPYPNRHAKRLTMLKQVGELMALAILREQVQSSLEIARDMAMRASVAKSEFLANISHEIRTPMNGVLGMLDLLGDTEMNRNQWELVETAYNSAEALLEIINAVLDYSKLEARKVDIEHVSFNLVVLVEEVSTLLARRAFAKGLELNCFIPPNLNPNWFGDPLRIRQVLSNLIGNAIKFTETGEVSVIMRPISTIDGKQLFLFEINDTGVGIPPNIQTTLFQPFTQADTATARKFGGTGLGLSISKSLVELMGGEIGLTSEVGKGSCFWFTLPLSVGDVAKNPELIDFIDFSGKRILVVDDNATNRKILQQYLSNWGFDVGVVECGQTALNELELAQNANQPYHVAILDMHMPVMDGLTLAAKLLENTKFNDLYRILLSSGELLNEDQRHKSGFSYSLLKPVRQSQLFEVLANLFTTKKLDTKFQKISEAKFPDYHDKKVLVVEDNKVNQKVLVGLLAKFNIFPVLADNGQIALEIVRNDASFDLIFMDCQMPVLDGYETTAAIRKLEQHLGSARHAIVALTAHAIAGEREKCLASGMDDYLSKPIKRDLLAETLAHWLDTDSNKSTIPNVPIAKSELSDETNNQPTVKLWNEEMILHNLDNDREVLVDMINSFLEEIPGLLAKLIDAYSQNNFSELANVAHAIKGCVSYFYTDELTELAARVERTSRLGEVSEYPILIDDLVNLVNNLVESLKHYIEYSE